MNYKIKIILVCRDLKFTDLKTGLYPKPQEGNISWQTQL